MITVALVIPCFNEAARLQPLRFIEFCPTAFHLRLIFVNDGSTDATCDVLRSIQGAIPDRAMVLSQRTNRGKAEAVRIGILEGLAEGHDFVGFWDADLSTPLEAIAEFLEVFASREDVHIVMGSRVQLMGRTVERSLWRHYLGRVFATLVSLMLRLRVYDTQCGAKLFRATRATREVFGKVFVSRWLFDVEVVARTTIRCLGTGEDPARLIYELPLREWRHTPGSKLSGRAYVRAACSLAGIWWVYGRGPGRHRDGGVRESRPAKHVYP